MHSSWSRSGAWLTSMYWVLIAYLAFARTSDRASEADQNPTHANGSEEQDVLLSVIRLS